MVLPYKSCRNYCVNRGRVVLAIGHFKLGSTTTGFSNLVSHGGFFPQEFLVLAIISNGGLRFRWD